MDVYFPVLILLGITAGPLCPLGCVGGIWKLQIRRIRAVVQPGSSDHRLGGWSRCAVGKLQSQGCCSEEHLSREKPHIEATYREPVCFESCPCAFHGGEVWAIKHRSGLVLTWEDDEPGNRQKITDCRNNFPGSVCRDFIFLFGKCWVSANHWVQWKKQLCEQHSWNEEKLILT